LHNDSLAIYLSKMNSYGHENYLDIIIDSIKGNEQDVKVYYNFLNLLPYKNALVVFNDRLDVSDVYVENKCGDLLVISLMPYSKGFMNGYWISDDFKKASSSDRHEWVEKNKTEFLNVLNNINIKDNQCE